MPDPVISDQFHAVTQVISRMHSDDVCGHAVADESVAGSPILEDHLAGVIPFREDADELILLSNHQRTDVVAGHPLQRIKNRGIGTDSMNCTALVSKGPFNTPTYLPVVCPFTVNWQFCTPLLRAWHALSLTLRLPGSVARPCRLRPRRLRYRVHRRDDTPRSASRRCRPPGQTRVHGRNLLVRARWRCLSHRRR